MSEERKQIDQIREAFEKEFGRFVDLRNKINSLSLSAAETLQREINEFKTKHTGKKSEIANAKKLIGRVAPEERGAFGQFVQSVEKKIVTAIEEAETNLNNFISDAKTERERLDVTLPGRRPRTGHLHLLTLLRQHI
jgi:phenylalanyl-tRNA synthetase alpha chain